MTTTHSDPVITGILSANFVRGIITYNADNMFSEFPATKRMMYQESNDSKVVTIIDDEDSSVSAF